MAYWVNHSFKGVWVSVLFAGFALACASGAQTKGAPDEQTPVAESNTMPPQSEELLQQSRTAERYVFGGQVYYGFIAPCCDQFNPMFDARGKYICAPSGGYTGRGDERCPTALIEALKNAKSTTVSNPFYRP